MNLSFINELLTASVAILLNEMNLAFLLQFQDFLARLKSLYKISVSKSVGHMSDVCINFHSLVYNLCPVFI